MERLCERPGCSDPASVAYGMRPEDLVFWLDVLRERHEGHGVLCRRHADSMVVPRGWTLDDLRDPDLHLFRPPSDDSGPIRRPRVRRAAPGETHEQLALGVELDAERPEAADVEAPSGEDESDQPQDMETTVPTSAGADEDQREAEPVPVANAEATTPWMPVFDTDDDLDGLLAANSPLLSRAFRGDRAD